MGRLSDIFNFLKVLGDVWVKHPDKTLGGLLFDVYSQWCDRNNARSYINPNHMFFGEITYMKNKEWEEMLREYK